MTFDALPAIVVTGIVAAALAYALTPLAMRVATRAGAIDNPDSGRRIHVRRQYTRAADDEGLFYIKPGVKTSHII